MSLTLSIQILPSDVAAAAVAVLVSLLRARPLAKWSKAGICARVSLPLLFWAVCKYQWIHMYSDWRKRLRARKVRESISNHESYDSIVDPFVRLGGGGEAFEDLYEVGRKVSNGTFGSVSVCKCKTSGGMAAVKIIPKSRLPLLVPQAASQEFALGVLEARKAPLASYEEPRSFWVYMHAVLNLNHDNVVKHHRFFAGPDSYYILMDYVEGDTLVEYLFSRRHWREADTRRVITPLLKALSYIHNMGIVHRDVKLTTLVVAPPAGGSDNLRLKLLDFGMGFKGRCGYGAMGTLGYMAPETFGPAAYTCTVDLFSAGVVLYVLFTGSPPFKPPIDSRKVQDHVAELTEGPDLTRSPFDQVSQPARDLLDWMLSPDPVTRCSADEALRHDWLRPAPDGLCPEGVLWDSSSSELQFLKVMGVWEGGAKNCRLRRKDSSIPDMHRIVEAEGDAFDDLLEECWSFVIRTMTVPVMVADPTKPDTPLLAISEGFESLTGYREEHVLGRSCHFLSEERADEVSAHLRGQLWEAGRSLKRFLGCLPHVRADGTHVWHLVHLIPMDVRGHRLVLGVLMDAARQQDGGLEGHEIIGATQKVQATLQQWLKNFSAGGLIRGTTV